MYHKTEQEIMKNWQGDKTKPVVSVCTITYNHEKYISEAIDSFLMQETDFPFEIVIGEDCSTDGTRKIVEEYVKKYPNIIKLITSESNVGGYKNFQRAFESCKGEYIALCEGDDYWTDPKKLQIQKDFLDNNEEYVMCHNDCKVVDESGNLIKEHRVEANLRRDITSEELQKGIMISTNTVFFRNIVALPYELKYVFNGDTFLWVLLGEIGKCKWMENIKPDVYRVHRGGIWSTLDNSHRKIIQATSFYYISMYYKRKGKESLSDHFLFTATMLIVSEGTIKFATKLGLKLLFPSIVDIYSFIKNLYQKYKK